MRLLSAYTVVLLSVLAAGAEENTGDYIPKAPAEEFRLAGLLADQGKYEDAVRHYGYVIKHFDMEEAKGGLERYYLTVARLHVAAYELKQARDNNECPPAQKDLCDTWLDALFPIRARAAGVGKVETAGKYATVRNTVEIRKLVKDDTYSGAVASGNISEAGAELLLKWVQDGHRLLVQDGTAALFGFGVAPVPATANLKVSQDRRATEHPLLQGVRPDSLLLVGATWGWCVTGHPSAKPLLTVSLPAAGGAPGVTVALFALAKSGKGDLLFCNSQFDSQTGDGGVLYKNLDVFLKTFPGQQGKAADGE